jgi:hypothetical protein
MKTMTPWDVDRYDWRKLKIALGDAAHIPHAIEALQRATTCAEAESAYWKIDNSVIVQGRLYEAAAATAACLVVMLGTPLAHSAKARVLELLQQLSAGTVHEGDTALVSQVAAEVGRGFAHYVASLQLGDENERELCIELVASCAINEPDLVPRVKFYLHRLADDTSVSARVRTYARRWVDDFRVDDEPLND